jgi:S-adenosylmethionine:tRNA-ribosyltransferase-isomerase (queuine synthetase)
MMVSAFAQQGAGGANDSGRQMMLDVYKKAIERHYRFYSFGDAMMIV